jgi:hypothetical protein
MGRYPEYSMDALAQLRARDFCSCQGSFAMPLLVAISLGSIYFGILSEIQVMLLTRNGRRICR